MTLRSVVLYYGNENYNKPEGFNPSNTDCKSVGAASKLVADDNCLKTGNINNNYATLDSEALSAYTVPV